MNYPLHWPATWPRCQSRSRARFGGRDGITVARAVSDLLHELGRLHASDVVVSTHLQTRADGMPRSGQRMPTDPGVAVYFKLRGKDRVLACDRWDRVEHNLRAIAKHVEALRGIDRWGVGTVEKAFDGYAALPDPVSASWWSVLGLRGADGVSERDVRARFRELAASLHPDRGGSTEEFARLVRARDDGLAHVARSGAHDP